MKGENLRYVWVALLIAGCGTGKLTDEQKNDLTSLLESVGTAQQEAQSEQGCQRTDYFPDAAEVSSLVPKPARTGFLLEGQACPVRMKFLFTTLGETTSLDLDYSIAVDSYSEKKDIQTIKLSGEAKNAVGDFEGSIHSKKFGTVNTRVGLSTDRAVVVFDFSKFSAEFLVFTLQGKLTFSLNGELISREQFYGTLKKAGDAFTRFAQIANPENSEGDSEIKDESALQGAPTVSAQPPQAQDASPSPSTEPGPNS